MRMVAVRIGAVDRPDEKRKIHTRVTPRLGGPVIAIAIFFALAAYWFMSPEAAGRALQITSPVRMLGFVGGLVVVLALGIVDDIKGVRPRTKIAVQTLAVVICFAAGYRVRVPFVQAGSLAFLSFPLTWFWLVACINSMNLVDGMDGLASGVAFFAGAVIFVLAVVYGKLPVAMMSAALLGSVVGFLMYNFHPAVMFLGDSGSLLLGYLIAILAMTASLKSHATVALLIPILALGVPIMDTLLAILRRWSRRLPISQADREHIHHKLLKLGFSHRGAVGVLYAACVLLAAAALAVASASSVVVGLVLAGLCISGMLAVHFVGAGEILSFTRRVGESLRAASGERQHSAVGRSAFCIAQARDWQQALDGLEPYAATLGAVGGKLFRSGVSEPLAQAAWGDGEAVGQIEEVMELRSGSRIQVVLEGVEGTGTAFPLRLRRALEKVLNEVEGANRGTDAVAVTGDGLAGKAVAR